VLVTVSLNVKCVDHAHCLTPHVATLASFQAPTSISLICSVWSCSVKMWSCGVKMWSAHCSAPQCSCSGCASPEGNAC